VYICLRASNYCEITFDATVSSMRHHFTEVMSAASVGHNCLLGYSSRTRLIISNNICNILADSHRRELLLYFNRKLNLSVGLSAWRQHRADGGYIPHSWDSGVHKGDMISYQPLHWSCLKLILDIVCWL
jgi:hypothetical protein